MPAHLKRDSVALAAWVTLCKSLKKMRVLGPQDGIVLEGLCMAYSRALKADAIVRKEGMLITRHGRRGGVAAHPAVRISVQAWRDVRQFAQEFGLTPSAATRVRAVSADATQAETAAAEAFLFRGGSSGKVVGHVGPPASREKNKPHHQEDSRA